jgi:hypothetical protein
VPRPLPLLFLLLPSLLSAGVVINEVAFDQPTGSPDWVELYNPGPGAASLGGWTLDDEDAAEGNEAVLPAPLLLPPEAFLLVYVDAEGPSDLDFSDGSGTVYTGTETTVSLASTEDELLLRSSGGPVDFLAWVTDGAYGGSADQQAAVAAGLWTAGQAASLADLGSGYSLARAADGADADLASDFLAAAHPTPGASNVSVPPPPPTPTALRDVVINEVSWGGTAASASHEWVELHNPGGAPRSLDGWRLRSADGDLDAVLSGLLPPGGFMLLERGSDAPVGDVAGAFFYVGSLSNGGEALTLEDATGFVVDALRFEGGWPAGTGGPGYRSMERVSAFIEGSLASNWRSHEGAANGVDAAGAPLAATPGAANAARGFSPSAAALPSGETLAVDRAANPFSPRDPDPGRRAARISFDGGDPDAAKVLRICDVRGEVVRTFSTGDGLDAAASGVVLWDGTDQQGRALPTGLYLVHFEATSPSGGRRRGRSTVVLGRPR